MMKTAALYARVSSDRQKEDHTIASQVAALVQYAESHEYVIPADWRFQDEGYSGATLLRPALEALRDLAAGGQLEAVLIYSPDRLSRKYAYQVLLVEELSRCGVEVIFLKAPSGSTPEDQLLVQFQGMIAEYERAQIAERSRRGKRHRAQLGSVNVLSGAPFGYRYVNRSDSSAAYYEVIESEAKIVQMVFDLYTRQDNSINAIARLLNQQQVPTRTGVTRWERSTVWGMLRNPAYKGRACFGKTEIRPRQRITRPLRQRNGISNRNSANRERPRQDWIEIAVPPLISEEIFALAQEQLEKNKRHSPRRTIEPTLLQGILVCAHCGYGIYRISTRTSRRRIYYYRCLGSDAYRHLKGAPCDCRPIRQDYLDAAVWTEIIRLLEDPGLIQRELDRRLEAARNSDPLRQRTDSLQKERMRLANRMERLVTAYQEDLISLDELRHRMPELRKQENAVQSEVESLETAAADQTRYLLLAETLADFREKIRARANTIDVLERQKILRLLVKEVLVGKDSITIRHSIPIPPSGPDGGMSPAPEGSGPRIVPSYLLRSGGNYSSLGRPLPDPSHLRLATLASRRLHDWRLQPHPDQFQHRPIRNAHPQTRHQLLVRYRVKVALQVCVIHRLIPSLYVAAYLRQRLMCRTTRPKPVRAILEVSLKDRLQYQQSRRLYYLVAHRWYAQWPELPVCLRYVCPPYRLRFVFLGAQFLLNCVQELLHARRLNHFDRDTVDARSRVPIPSHPLPCCLKRCAPENPVV